MPDKNISGQEFVTLLLSALQFTNSNPESAYSDAAEYGLVSSRFLSDLSVKNNFLRDDTVYLLFRALKTKTKDGKLLSDKLIENGVFTDEEAESAGIRDTEFKDMNDIINDIIDDLFN